MYRLDQRSDGGGRPVISQRGFIAARQGLDALREQLHAEALWCGVGPAAGALVLGMERCGRRRGPMIAGLGHASGWIVGVLGGQHRPGDMDGAVEAAVEE